MPSSIFGFGLGVNENPPAINVNKNVLHNSFLSGFNRYGNIWEKVICQPEWIELKKVREIPKDKFYYHSNLWARILFDFAISYRNNELPKEKVIDALIPFFHSRLLSFVNKTSHMETKECEEYFESIVRIFESEKYYLIKRWDQDQIKLGHKLFKRKV